MSGCASSPYAEIGLGYQIDGMSDYWLQTERPWQCSNLQFHGEVGLEFDSGWTVGYHHQSWLRCGKPLGNNKPEVYTDDIRVMKKFGGK